jgi:hypothetical protein
VLDADGCLHLIDVLSPLPSGPVRAHFEIDGVYFDLHIVFDFGVDKN